MEQEFTRDRYVSKEMRAELASKLSLTEKQVKKWFENRRQKEKRSKGRNGNRSDEHWMEKRRRQTKFAVFLG